MKKSINTTAYLGAVNQLGQFVTTHSQALTDAGINPEGLKTKLATCCSNVQTIGQDQADAKTTLKNKTKDLNDAVGTRYAEFSSVIDLLRGVVGNNTPLGKQLTNIRKQANRRSGRSSTAATTANTSVKIAA